MQTYNYTIADSLDIEPLIKTHHIKDNSQLLIQIFAGNNSYDYILALQHQLQHHFKDAVIIGTTTDGAIMSGRVIPTQLTVLTFTQFDNTFLHSTLVHQVENDPYLSGMTLAQTLKPHQPNALICFGTGAQVNGELLLDGIKNTLEDTVVAGGLAAHNRQLQPGFVFNQHEIIDKGAVAVSLSNPNLHILTHFNFDWIPIGLSKKVTKAINNRVYTIENISAVDFYAKYLGQEIARQLPKIGIEFPLLILRHGEYVGRTVLKKYDDGSLLFAGHINEGEDIRFGIGNSETIFEKSLASNEQVKSRCVESIFIYSSMARRHFLGKNIHLELNTLHQKAITSGFFTCGSFYHTRLLNASMTYLALSEHADRIACSESVESVIMQETDHKITTFQALSHLINTVSHDLDTFNNSLEHILNEQTEEIFNQLYYDRLTMLPNRIKLIQDLPAHEGKYLVLFNIDRFSRINDFYGFKAGDRLIQHFTKALSKRVSQIGTIYKLPSDECALIVNNESLKIKELLKELVHDFSHLSLSYLNIDIPYTLTMGTALINEKGEGLHHADTAVKHAKRSQSPYLFYEQIRLSNHDLEKNLLNAAQVREAIVHERLCMHYQPLVDLSTMKIASYECLARICLEDAILMPKDFLPVVTNMRLNSKLTHQVIAKTFAFFADKEDHFSINLNIDDILDPETVSFIHESLKKFNVASQLTFEILETQQIRNISELIHFIDTMQALGAHIAIDDFGSGFANFENLTKIHADKLKIDGTLIKQIDTDKNARIIVETIITFAQKLGMKTVAEYVHTERILLLLKEIGVDFVQGHYLYPPEKTLVQT